MEAEVDQPTELRLRTTRIQGDSYFIASVTGYRVLASLGTGVREKCGHVWSHRLGKSLECSKQKSMGHCGRH